MVTKANLQRQINDIRDSNAEDFGNVQFDISNIIDRVNDISICIDEFNEIRKEIENNGVVRDLRKLQKEHEELKKHTSNLIMEHDEQLLALKTNGVATAINKINKELFQDSKEKKPFYDFYYKSTAYENQEEPTIAGKVEAIIAYLGLDFEVKPEKVISKKVEVKKVVKKVKKVSKK